MAMQTIGVCSYGYAVRGVEPDVDSPALDALFDLSL
jgi:hypothetical protein